MASYTQLPYPACHCSGETNQPDQFSGMYEPSICMAVQGARRVILGEDTYVYDAPRFLITSVRHRCQALNVPPALKYENRGGPGIGNIMSLLMGSDYVQIRVVYRTEP